MIIKRSEICQILINNLHKNHVSIDLLDSMLWDGFKGYNNYTHKELIREYQDKIENVKNIEIINQ